MSAVADPVWEWYVAVPAPNLEKPLTTSATTKASIPTGGNISKTQSARIGVATSPLTPWVGHAKFPTTPASVPSSPVATLETTNTEGSSFVLTKLRHLLEVCTWSGREANWKEWGGLICRD